MLVVSDNGRELAVGASNDWPGKSPGPDAFSDAAEFWGRFETQGRVVEFEALRHGIASSDDKALLVPKWLLDEPASWACIPLLHHQRLVGLVVLAAPDYHRQLDWEDLALLRTPG